MTQARWLDRLLAPLASLCDRLRASGGTRYRLLVEQMGDGLFVADATGRYLDVNPAGCAMFGMTREEILACSIHDLIVPEQAALLPACFEGGPAGGVKRSEWRYRRKDGSTFEGEVLSRFLPDGRLQGILRDVTERKRAAEALREMDRRKDHFLATLSHELRNPLAPIRSAAELLASEGLPPERAAWAQQVIRRQAGHMARLLDDLLDVARITQGKLTLRREQVPLAVLVDTALETARPAILARRHALDVTLPTEPVVLDVDPLRLAQALANLLTNAARYTEPGGHIALGATCTAGRLTLSVRDDGIGIPPGELASIFEMFAQVEGGGGDRERGLGIGLALVRGLVALHGGTVTARSEGLGRGSEFVLALPPSAIVRAPSAAATAGDEAGAGTPARVLVVDDNRDAADSLGELLRAAGYGVRVAYGGRDALGAARSEPPDVMLVDVGMPDMDGYRLAAAMRTEPWGQRVRLVAVTGWGRAADRADALAAGFDAHLTKPVEFSGLRAVLERVAMRTGEGRASGDANAGSRTRTGFPTGS